MDVDSSRIPVSASHQEQAGDTEEGSRVGGQWVSGSGEITSLT